MGTSYVEAIYGASGDYGGSTSNIVPRWSTRSGPRRSSPARPTRRPTALGDLHRHGLCLVGHAGRLGDLLQLWLHRRTAPQVALGPAVTLSSGKATFTTSSLPAGTTYVEAIYGASGNYGGSTSNIVSQVVNTLGTTSVLTSSPNPSIPGKSVTFTDTVSASTGTPGGTVTFYNCGSSSSLQLQERPRPGVTLSSGKASFATSSMPAGTTYVEAIYGASGNYGGSTSNIVSQVVIGIPSVCTSGGYERLPLWQPLLSIHLRDQRQ